MTIFDLLSSPLRPKKRRAFWATDFCRARNGRLSRVYRSHFHAAL